MKTLEKPKADYEGEEDELPECPKCGEEMSGTICPSCGLDTAKPFRTQRKKETK